MNHATWRAAVLGRWMFFLILACLPLGQGVAKGLFKVAVMPVEAAPGVSPNLREKVRLELESQLVKSGKVEVIERAKLKQITEEMKLTLQGVMDPATAQQLGKLTGVSVFLFPRITSAWASQHRVHQDLIDEDEVTVKAGFQLALKLVQTETGKILASETVSGSFRKTRMESEGGIPSRGGALAAARAAAVKRAGSVILGALYPIKVAHYNPKTGVVMINRGKGSLRVGQRLKVFSQGEAIIDPDTGEVLGADEEQIGLIKVTSVRAKYSKARILKGSVERGAICR